MLDFRIGSRVLASSPIQTITMLGGTALLPDHDTGLEEVICALFDMLPRYAAVGLPAMPYASPTWQKLGHDSMLARRYRTYVEYGWRECHTIPLPADFDLYEQQFSKKKRYNLNRQIRLLRESGTDLTVHRIERSEQVGLLMSSVRSLDKDGLFLSENKYRALADLGLLLCYLLELDGRPCAVLMGTRFDSTFHLHSTMHDETLNHLSPGTSLLHLAIRDLILTEGTRLIDLGYGVPSRSYQSSNVTMTRGQVLFLRKTMRNRLLCRMHKGLDYAIAQIKKIRDRSRQSSPKASPQSGS
jgi:hypothetical protein